MYGAQTTRHSIASDVLFENDVEMYGAQTSLSPRRAVRSFENDVEMYGAQTLALLLQ